MRFVVVSVALALGFLACRDSELSPTPINVVLISIDSLRADHVHAYGYGRRTTPTIDRIARQGALFENVVAASSWTLPTHVTMLTGLTPRQHGVEYFSGSRLESGITTLGEVLQNAGYQTYGVFSGPYLHPTFGLHRGFHRYESADGEVLCLDGDCNARPDSLATDRAIRVAHEKAHRTVTSPMVTKRSLDFLQIREPGKPFFMFLHYFDVHHDYIPPEEYWRKFDARYEGRFSGRDFENNPEVHPFMDARKLRHLVARYDGEISYTDFHIGNLLRALNQRGLSDDTLVVVTSDHGDEFFEHRGKGHGRTLFDEVIRVPLVMKLPGRIEPGTRITAQVRQQDMMPTILGLAGVEDYRGSESATDLSRRLLRGEEPRSRVAVSRLRLEGLWTSVRTERAKLLVHEKPDEDVVVSFYDLEEDAREKLPVGLDELPSEAEVEGEAFEELWSAFEASITEPTHDGSPTDGTDRTLPESVREQLRALGYIP